MLFLESSFQPLPPEDATAEATDTNPAVFLFVHGANNIVIRQIGNWATKSSSAENTTAKSTTLLTSIPIGDVSSQNSTQELSQQDVSLREPPQFAMQSWNATGGTKSTLTVVRPFELHGIDQLNELLVEVEQAATVTAEGTVIDDGVVSNAYWSQKKSLRPHPERHQALQLLLGSRKCTRFAAGALADRDSARQPYETVFVCEVSSLPLGVLLAKLNQKIENPLIQEVVAAPLRDVAALIQRHVEAGDLSVAVGLGNFHRAFLFCSICGEATTVWLRGRCRICSGCKKIEYARQDPAVLCLVHSGNFCLLGRKRYWTPGRYSCLAGYVEIGEAPEQTVVREVLEESGVQLARDSIQFAASQPWVFTRSLVLGFIAAPEPCPSEDMRPGRAVIVPPNHPRLLLESRKLPITRPDLAEIEDVRWFCRDILNECIKNEISNERDIPVPMQLPDIPGDFHLPPKFTLARHLINQFINGHLVRQTGQFVPD